MEAILKSCMYLGIFGTVGYVLLKATEPSEEKKRIISQSGNRDPSFDEAKRKKALFLDKLKEASTDTPIYLKKVPSSTTNQEAPQQPTKREIN